MKTEYSFCGRYKPWYVSKKDTLKTIRQARVHNELFQGDCPADK